MMQHLVMLPVLLPALIAVAIVLAARGHHRRAAWLSLAGSALGLACSVMLLLGAARGELAVYALGDWAAPYGIVFVVDRLSALMLVLTWTLGTVCAIAALDHGQARGASFHALLQLELMGVSGAFCTGDLFNLFVCFEILLAASYGLLVVGGGRARIVSALHYVVLNLVGSSVFLIALGIIYGTAGTLNLADLALAVLRLDPGARVLLESAAGMLIVVFGLKAALLPLHAWLPSAYGAAIGPVAALFAIMTKVGVYAIVRVFGTAFGAGGATASTPVIGALFLHAMLALALVTLAAGALGALGARDLRQLVAQLVLVSVGMLLVAVAPFDGASVSAALYYMVHSTLATAGLFLVAELVADGRGGEGAALTVARPMAGAALVGTLYLLLAVAVVGMPPLAGFIGKVLILRSALATPAAPFVFAVVLVGSLLGLVALSRAGSVLFWRAQGEAQSVPPARPVWLAALLLLVLGVALVVFGEPVMRYTDAAAAEVVDPTRYVRAVLGGQP